MDENAKSYLVVKVASCEEFRVKHYLQKLVKDALLLKLLENKLAYEFALKAEKAYKDTGSTMKRNIVFFQ